MTVAKSLPHLWQKVRKLLIPKLFLSYSCIFGKKKSNPLYDLFIAHPELNASAVARRLGLSQSLFAQYVSGTKKPSKQRFDEIIETIREIGRELMTVLA